jgi:anti-anti-sigma regulatory factor
MTLRIERRRSGDTLIVQLIGELDIEHIAEVNAQVNDARPPVVVDIGELTLIGVEGIRFLNTCRDNGMAIINASGYVTEWMMLEAPSEPKRS